MAATRDERIDALKCLAIVLVVIGHAVVYNGLFGEPSPTRVPIGTQWIERSTLDSVWLNIAYSFHMPLFAFASAFVLFGRERAPMDLVARRAVGLMLPFVVWTALAHLGPGQSVSGMIESVGHALLYPQSPGAVWFLYALFGCFVLFAVVRALGGRDRMLAASAVVAAAVIVAPIPAGNIFGVYDIAWLYPFFVMGYLSSEHRGWLKEHNRALLAGGALLWLALLPVIWPVLVPEVNWWYPELREWLHARDLFGGIVVLYAARYLCAAAAIVALFQVYDRAHGRFLRWQAWVGRRTLGMYVTQPIILATLSAHVTKSPLVLTLLTLAGGLGITLVLERARLTRLVFLGQASRGLPQSAVE